jgi:hypothetical protein
MYIHAISRNPPATHPNSVLTIQRDFVKPCEISGILQGPWKTLSHPNKWPRPYVAGYLLSSVLEITTGFSYEPLAMSAFFLYVTGSNHLV